MICLAWYWLALIGWGVLLGGGAVGFAIAAMLAVSAKETPHPEPHDSIGE